MKFLILVIISALTIALIAAIFSVTGIATLFSGHFLQVAIMAGSLEVGKAVLASLLYRYWKKLAIIHKIYLTTALIVLIIVTSLGIFGYLSESYQKTKGDYTIIENEVNNLNSKKIFFEDRKERLIKDKEIEIKTKISNQTRADSLSSRNQSITRTRSDIKENELNIKKLENQISSNEDSIGVYNSKIIELKSKNIKGELGPLQYVANAFGVEMDLVVKWLILILIFVFDPLAVSLIIAANMIFMNKFESSKSIVTNIDIKKEEIKDSKEIVKETETEKIEADIKVEKKEDIEISKKVKNKHRWKSANWKD